MKHRSVLLPTQFRRAWWSHAKLSNMCLFACISSQKPEGFASRGCCPNSALNPQGPPSPCSVSGTPCSPACQTYFSFSNQRWSVPGDSKGGLGDAVVLRDRRLTSRPLPSPGSAQPWWEWPGPHKRVLEKYQGPFFPLPGFETNSLHSSLSLHQSHSCCMSVWGLDWSHFAMLLPHKYLLVLLHCFAVVFPSAPNYNKTIY